MNTGPRLFTATIAATAGNVATTITVPENGMYNLIYGQVSLTADATAANRRVVLHGRDSAGNILIDIHAGDVVTANEANFHHEFMRGVFRETTFVGDALQVPVPQDLWLNGGEDIYIDVENGVAGDSYSGYLRFEFAEMPPY